MSTSSCRPAGSWIAAFLLVTNSSLVQAGGGGGPVVHVGQDFPNGLNVDGASNVTVTANRVSNDLVVTVQGQGGVIVVNVTGNTVEQDLIVRVINNDPVISIDVDVLNNDVGRNLLVQILGNNLRCPSGLDIDAKVNDNSAGGLLQVTVGSNFVCRDLKAEILDNLAAEDLLVSIGKGVGDEASGNIVLNLTARMEANAACGKMQLGASENTIDQTMSVNILKNLCVEDMSVEVSKNKRPSGFDALFTGLTVNVLENTSKEDLTIQVNQNELALLGSPQIRIRIEDNRSFASTDIDILNNIAAPQAMGRIDIDVKRNYAGSTLDVLIQNNSAATVVITVTDNGSGSGVSVVSQMPATIMNNSARPSPPTVEIREVGQTSPPTLKNVGELVRLDVGLFGVSGVQSHRWSVGGQIIKDYSEITQRPWSVTSMTGADFQQQTIGFYWKPALSQVDPKNGGPVTRVVTVAVRTAAREFRDMICVEVERNNTDIDRQAEDFYTGNHNDLVLKEHRRWHLRHSFNRATQGGFLFFKFHRQYISRFDSWRKEFGYPVVGKWDPQGGLPSPQPVEIMHDDRLGDTNASDAKPTWFTMTGGTIARGDAPRREWAGCGDPCPCDSDPTQRGQKKLIDFPADQKLLGCAVEAPWHNRIHGKLGGDMSGTSTAPRDPIFWQWHNFVDDISKERSNLSHLTPPQMIFEVPFRLYYELTEFPIEVSVTFDEEVTEVAAGLLTVNGSAATAVSGSEEGPYAFSGFAAPPLGTVTVTFAPGGIHDLFGNAFAGESWEYLLLTPEADPDGDSLPNSEEVNTHLSDPLEADSDGDGIDDGTEVAAGSEPLDRNSPTLMEAAIPGDCNLDGVVDISDAICLLGFLFLGNPRELPCLDEAANEFLVNSNFDDAVDLADAVYLLSFLFLGTDPPVLGQECIFLAECSGVCASQ